MTDFRFLAVQYLRAKTLTDICELANRSYKGYTSDERECLMAIAKVVTCEIIEKRRKEREKNV
mgnify:FL=1